VFGTIETLVHEEQHLFGAGQAKLTDHDQLRLEKIQAM
jgi:hypothetical protein